MKIKFRLLTSAEALQRSNGELTRWYTIHPNTGRPRKGGLFDPAIYGPPRLYACLCGYLQDARPGWRCPHCKTTILSPEDQLQRRGHLRLASTLPHPLYESLIAQLLAMGTRRYRALLAGEAEGIVNACEQTPIDWVVGRLKNTSKNDVLQFIASADAPSAAWLFPLTSTTHPSQLLLDVILIPPPAIRPILRVTRNYWTCDPMNKHYQGIFAANIRLQAAQQSGQPPFIQAAYQYILYAQVRDLMMAWMKRIHGKYGWLRHDLLGRRVDYSARAVIVQDETLAMDECRLPYHIAIEIWQPILVHALIRAGLAGSIREARVKLQEGSKKTRQLVDEVLQSQVVWLNRPPTLHQANLLAFTPRAWDELAIGISPAVCSGFNADFDGDQMSAFACCTKAAQREAHRRALSTKHFCRAADGEPSWTPAKEYLFVPPGLSHPRFEQLLRASPSWAAEIVEADCRALHQRPSKRAWQTLIGDLLGLAMIVDGHAGAVAEIIQAHYHAGESLRVPISVGLADVDAGGAEHAWTAHLKRALKRGLIGEREYMDIAARRSEEELAAHGEGILDRLPPVLREILSRGASKSGVGGIAIATGGYGPMRDMHGKLDGAPLIRGILYRLSPAEYLRACHAQRRGLYETYEGTAKAGYLTRQLMEVVQNVRVVAACDEAMREPLRCEPNEALPYRATWCYAAADCPDCYLRHGDLITPLHVRLAMQRGAKLDVYVPDGCAAGGDGVCAGCYGLKLSVLEPPAVGEWVGVIAAQAVGEPITQAMLRAFYVGSRRREMVTDYFERPEHYGTTPRAWALALQEALAANGTWVHYQHIALIGRALYKDGQMCGISVIAPRRRSLLARASYRDARHEILKAAIYQSTDNLEDVKSRIMLGMPLDGGGGGVPAGS